MERSLLFLLDDDPVLGEQLWQVLQLVDGDPQHLRLRAVEQLQNIRQNKRKQ